MKAYLGETKFQMLEEFGAIREKYGAQSSKCEIVFQVFQNIYNIKNITIFNIPECLSVGQCGHVGHLHEAHGQSNILVEKYFAQKETFPPLILEN